MFLIVILDDIIMLMQMADVERIILLIMEGVLVLHETLNTIHQKKQNAYDIIECPFVYQMLEFKGCPSLCTDLV